MKNLVILILAALFLNSCKKENDRSIGIVISKDKYSINEQVQDSLILDWNKTLKQSNINDSISELKIVKEKDMKNYKYYYSILGITINDLAKVKTEIEIKSQKFYFPKSEISSLVVCHGSSNCYPRMNDGKWICDDGSNKPSCSLDCQKSVISSIND